MKTFRLNYSVYILIILLLGSCSSMYIPSSVSIPLLEEKGEAQVELTTSTNSLHLTGNYAFSKKFSLMLNGSMSYRNISRYYDIFTKVDAREQGLFSDEIYGEFAHKYGEIGIGRYNILQKKTKFEIFAGMGYGYANDKANSSIGTLNYNADYYLGFIQINIGRTLNKFDFGGAIRVASSFYDYTYQIDPSSGIPEHNNGLPQNIRFTLIHIEPTAFIRLGDEKFKFVVQLGLSRVEPLNSFEGLDVNKAIYDGRINTSFLHISLGLNMKFGTKKEKKVYKEQN